MTMVMSGAHVACDPKLLLPGVWQKIGPTVMRTRCIRTPHMTMVMIHPLVVGGSLKKDQTRIRVGPATLSSHFSIDNHHVDSKLV